MKKILLILSMILMFGLGACTISNIAAKQERPLTINFENQSGIYETLCVVDTNTGVNYIVVGVGNTYGGTCITPRLNKDGSLYYTKGE